MEKAAALEAEAKIRRIQEEEEAKKKDTDHLLN